MPQPPSDSVPTPAPGSGGEGVNPGAPAISTPGSAPATGSLPAAGVDPVADRRHKLHRLRSELKVDPFGQRVDGLISLAEARAKYDAGADAAMKTTATPKFSAVPERGCPQPPLPAPEAQRAGTPALPAAAPPVDRRPVVRVAGRIVLHRDIGKLVFMTLRDASGDLQVGVSKKAVDELSFNLAKLADLGDIAVAAGRLGTTKTGEITVWAESAVQSPKSKAQSQDQTVGAESATLDLGLWTLDPPAFSIASKSLAAPPEKWHGLQDSELRYRQRYVDLWANPGAAKVLQLRMRIVEEIRAYFRGRGFLEVETPMLQPLHGGAAARPFITHHNALDMKLYLRIAPELYLKRLLVGGFPKVFEINRNFRNEGISPRHNPEFTMLEAYEAFGSWETMADLVEDMVCTVAQKVFGTLKIDHKAPGTEGKVTRSINLQRPWRRVRMTELVEERTGWKFDKQPIPHDGSAWLGVLDAYGNQTGAVYTGEDTPGAEWNTTRLTSFIHHLSNLSPAEQLVEVYEKIIEPTLLDPTFVTHVPSVAIPLARENRDDPYFADVYELAINGVEISPGYSELNDPDVQEKHFRHQVGDREEQQQVDEDFLNALRVGMPPAGGMGLGIDRLVMMLTGAESIRDVILFPLMRPQT